MMIYIYIIHNLIYFYRNYRNYDIFVQLFQNIVGMVSVRVLLTEPLDDALT